MHIALIYDDLVQKGGGEELFITIVNDFPEATIYVPIISNFYKKKLNKRNLFYSNYLSFLANKLGTPGYYLASLLSVFWFENLNLSSYDIVISVSNRWSHCVITSTNSKHIALITSPFRALWESTSSRKGEAFFQTLIFSFLRTYNFYSFKRPNRILSISKFVDEKMGKFKRCVLNLQHKPKTVLYPPFINKFVNIEEDDFYNLPFNKYFLLVGRLNEWKTPYFEEALHALKNEDSNFIIVGEGSCKKELKNKFQKIKNASFVGRATDKKLAYLYKNCTALIHPQVEDFGLTPLEALYFNKPVIAYKKGGVIEYLNSHVALFYVNTVDLKGCLRKIENFDFSKKEAEKILNLHSKEKFKYNLIQRIKNA